MKIIGKVPIWALMCLFSLSQSTEAICTSGLPSISKYFNVSDSLAQSTSTSYFLGFALGIFILGRVSDIFGRRPVILVGMGIYIISSIIIISVGDIWVLMALRFCQAFGASVGSVVAQAMARDSYQGWRLSYVYSSISMAIVFIPSLGSVIGGYIVEYCGWRYIFVFLTILATSLFSIYFKYLPETNSYINTSNNHKYFNVFKIVIRDKVVLLYAFIVGAYTGMLFGLYIEAPFIFINKAGLSPSSYGKLGFCLTLSGLVGSVISRKLLEWRVSPNKLIIIGLTFSLFGCICLNFASTVPLDEANQNSLIVTIFIPMMIQVLSHTFVMPVSLRYALEDYYKVTGTAGSIFGSLYYFVVVTIIFTISKLHSTQTITKFTLLYLLLSAAACYAFYLILKWHPIRKSYEF